MSRGSTTLEDRLLQPILRHLEAEATRDVEATLATITPDCYYEFPWQDITIEGHAELTDYYRLLFDSRPGRSLPPTLRRCWVSGEDTVCAEMVISYESGDGENTPILQSSIMSVFEVRDGLLSAEIIYVSEFQSWAQDWRTRKIEKMETVRSGASD